ncbi:MAG TPA: hypothetical protein VGR36_09060 [Candidatus Acidoferrales bacterium]|nr:hypothetical protein [Candidatus Acidoferrales bacterium]
MADEKSDKPKQSLTDDQIVTERTLGRRSFLTSVGAIVAGGAAALALGNRLDAATTAQQQNDPDKKPSDPDQTDKKKTDPDKKKGDPDRTDKKKGDPDKKKRPDPDKKKGDPDKQKVPAPDPDGSR